MAGLRIEGNTSGNVAEVTTTNDLKVNLPLSKTTTGYAVILAENDDGSLSGGTPQRRAPAISTDNRLQVGLDTPLFDSGFTSTTQDTGVWKFSALTMTAAQSGGYVTFNFGNSTAATVGAALSTWRNFSLVNNGGLRISVVAGPTAAIPANQVAEFGWFTPASSPTAAPTEGVYYRITSAGPVGVVNFNGVETSTSVLDSSQIVANTTIEYQIRIYTDSCSFWAGGKFLGTIPTPAGNPQATMTSTLPVAFQFRNSGTVGAPAQWKLGHVSVDARDTQMCMPYDTQQAAMGLMGYQGTSGNTQGTTALYSNSLAAGAGAAMTNTTAALGVGLGGQFSALPTLTAGTDGIVCSYAVPAGTINIRPRMLVVKGVKIQSAVTTVLTGGPVLYAYSLAYGHTNVSLATTEGSSFAAGTAKAPRRIALGLETFASAAAAGVVGSPNGIYMPFTAPVIVNPGEFIAVVAKNLGTVTTAGVITFLVTFDAYWV